MKYNVNDEHNIIDVFNKINDIKSYINATSSMLTGRKREQSEGFRDYIFEHLDELKEMIKSKIV